MQLSLADLQGGNVKRTPDTAFSKLPDFAFAPHYISDFPGFEIYLVSGAFPIWMRATHWRH